MTSQDIEYLRIQYHNASHAQRTSKEWGFEHAPGTFEAERKEIGQKIEGAIAKARLEEYPGNIGRSAL